MPREELLLLTTRLCLREFRILAILRDGGGGDNCWLKPNETYFEAKVTASDVTTVPL